jgi:hypothetical protein
MKEKTPQQVDFVNHPIALVAANLQQKHCVGLLRKLLSKARSSSDPQIAELVARYDEASQHHAFLRTGDFHDRSEGNARIERDIERGEGDDGSRRPPA